MPNIKNLIWRWPARYEL